MKMLQIATLCLAAMCWSCGSADKADNNAMRTDSVVTDSVPLITKPTVGFNSDSAYSYVARQVEFGPRVPGTKEHKACGDYLIAQLKKFGADTVKAQTGKVTAFNGDELPYRNIMATFKGDSSERILLLAHWDTRPWADRDPDAANHNKPILGANDGASGVGVLLEVARQLQMKRPKTTIDLLFVDVEDYGTSEGENSDRSWCLGSREWADSKPYSENNAPEYAILLDMVGAKDAIFYREYLSQTYAPEIVDMVWQQAVKSGYGNRFPNSVGGAITDDHLQVIRAGIPCIDIIECGNMSTGSFHPSWHTLNDNMSIIDRETLKAVGQVVIDLIYNE